LVRCPLIHVSCAMLVSVPSRDTTRL
jgi:hypothetical protein